MSGALSEEGKPIDMLRVLQSLVLDTCTVSNTIMQTSSAGNTFATIWLANRVTKLQVKHVQYTSWHIISDTSFANHGDLSSVGLINSVI